MIKIRSSINILVRGLDNRFFSLLAQDQRDRRNPGSEIKENISTSAVDVILLVITLLIVSKFKKKIVALMATIGTEPILTRNEKSIALRQGILSELAHISVILVESFNLSWGRWLDGLLIGLTSLEVGLELLATVGGVDVVGVLDATGGIEDEVEGRYVVAESNVRLGSLLGRRVRHREGS